jgi:hypothetical protein
VQHAEADQARLFAARDHVERQVRLALGPPHDLVAVLRLAHRAGRHRLHPRVVPAAQRRVPPKGRQQAIGDFLLDDARLEQAFARAHRVALLVQRLDGAVGLHPRQLEPHGVRARVDRREDVVWHVDGIAPGHRASSLIPARLNTGFRGADVT